MKYRIFISSVQDEFAAERRVLTECHRRKGSLRRPMRMSCPTSRTPSKIEGVPRQRRGSIKPMGVARYKLTQRPPKGLAEIKKVADKLGAVVDETFMESELPSKHDVARKGKEVSNG